MFKPLRNKSTVLTSIGIVLSCLGIALYIFFPSLFRTLLENQMVIADGTYLYKVWKTMPFPIYAKFHFFNITNPMDIYQLKHKPILKELGPYTFLVKIEKSGIEWHDNGTVSYSRIKRYYYQPHLSNGSLDDNITQINLVMMAAASKAREIDSWMVYMTVTEFLDISESTWLIQKPVRQLLFDGYEDNLLNMMGNFVTLPFDKFGYSYKRNGTIEGNYTMYTGSTDLRMRGMVDKYNNLPGTHGYDAPCNVINGTTGELFPAFLEAGKNISVFGYVACRNLNFLYSRTDQFHGIEIYKYVSDVADMESGEIRPENECFCPKGNCLPSGALDIKQCNMGAPVIFSQPHFLDADHSYFEAVEGLHPDPEKHQSHLLLHPETGLPLRAFAGAQLTGYLEQNDNIPQFQNLTGRQYIPVLWVSEEAEVDESAISLFKFVFNYLELIVNIFSYCAICIGILLVIYVIFGISLRRKLKTQMKNKKDIETMMPLTKQKNKKMKKKCEIVKTRETIKC